MLKFSVSAFRLIALGPEVGDGRGDEVVSFSSSFIFDVGEFEFEFLFGEDEASPLAATVGGGSGSAFSFSVTKKLREFFGLRLSFGAERQVEVIFSGVVGAVFSFLYTFVWVFNITLV